ncbi:hypothetical protein F4801DRAFT_559281 [Xylaria longipes]|nr:hypothetical protein F4801DRAFT_559281 [Xylaria longipes]
MHDARPAQQAAGRLFTIVTLTPRQKISGGGRSTNKPSNDKKIKKRRKQRSYLRLICVCMMMRTTMTRRRTINSRKAVEAMLPVLTYLLTPLCLVLLTSSSLTIVSLAHKNTHTLTHIHTLPSRSVTYLLAP